MKRTLFLVAVLGGVASIANFGYQIVVASQLSPAAFGLFAAMMTFIVAIGAGASGFQVVTARAISTKRNWSPEPSFLDPTTRDGLGVSLILVAVGLALSPLIAGALRISTGTALLLVCFVPISIFQALAIGKIQGSGAVTNVAVIGLTLAGLKFTAGIAVLVAGGGAVGLILSLLVTNAAVLVIITKRAHRSGTSTARLWSPRAWILVLAQTSFWAFVSIDLLIPRIALEETEAGLFAASATLAKVVLFLPALFATAVLPWSGRLFGQAEGRRKLATATLGLSLVVSVVGATVLAVFAPYVVQLLFGSEYAESAVYLPALSFAYVPIAISSIVLQFHFTSERSIYAITCMFTFAISFALVFFGPSEPFFYVGVIGVMGLLQLVALIVERFLYPATDVSAQRGESHRL